MRVLPMITRRTNFPVAYWRYFHLPKDRRLEQSIAVVHDFVMEMIDKARRDLAQNPARQPGNLLQAMIAATKECDSGIDDEIIYANVVTLLLADEDTTAHTLAWTLYCLAERPAMQTHLQRSAQTSLGQDRIVPSHEATNDLGLFDAAAFEAMRFKPLVPLIFLESREHVMLGDVLLEPDTPVFLSLRAAMQDETNFDQPENFSPQRWIERSDAGVVHNSRAFMQFGAGPRVCPGRHLAILEIRMALSMLSRNFSVQLATSPDKVAEKFSFTMLPDTMPLRFSKGYVTIE